jgi:hypothetical protein
MADHAKLSPSASSIWMNCPGQPTLAAGLVDEGSKWALQGTAAHQVLEWCLTTKRDTAYYAGQAVPVEGPQGAVSLDADDLAAVQIAVDYVRGEIEDGDEAEYEVRLKLNDDLWGTADVVRYRPSTGELLVVDYKHGSGVAVEAKNNPQGVAYALMKMKMMANRGISKVRFVIVQPRCFREDGSIREFEVDGLDMWDWEDRFADAVHAVREAANFSDDIPAKWAADFLSPGAHCRWCKAAGICPALKTQAEEALTMDFSAVEPGAYDVAELAKARTLVDRVKAWATAVDSFAYSEAERGVKIPGWKLVAKRPTRRVRDEDGVRNTAELIGVPTEDLLTQPEMKSPAQLEATFEPHMAGGTKKARTEAAKAFLKDHIEATSGGHTLVPESDDRPPIRGDVTDDFGAVAD